MTNHEAKSTVIRSFNLMPGPVWRTPDELEEHDVIKSLVASWEDRKDDVDVVRMLELSESFRDRGQGVLRGLVLSCATKGVL